MSLVPGANVVSPPSGMHEEDEVMIGDGYILHPRLPLVRIPGMLFQHCFYLLDGLRVLLLQDLVGDGTREHVAGDVPG